MAVTLDQLSAAVHSFFTRKLSGAVGDSTGDVLLVLDGLGSPLPPSEFGAGLSASQQQLLAHQRAAQLADQLPAANGLANGWYVARASSRLSFWYKALLTGSICTSKTEQAIAAFEARKASALKRLQENELTEIAGATDTGGTVLPTGVSSTNFATGMSPTNWFVADADCWERHVIDGTEPVPPAPAPVPVPHFDAQILVSMPEPPPGDMFAGDVDILKAAGDTVSEGELFAQQHFFSRHEDGSPDFSAESTVTVDVFAPVTGTVLDTVFSADNLQPGDQIGTVGVRRFPAVAAERNAVAMPHIDKPGFVPTVRAWRKNVGDAVAEGEPLADIKFHAPVTDDEFDFVVQSPVSGTLLEINLPAGEFAAANAQLAVVGAAPRPVEGFTVEFEYTIVTFSRPWWDEVFLSANDWMVPGFRRGGAANGSVAEVAAAGITLITTGVVVVRNLHITSNWADTERDQLARGALNLGPFSLTGAEVQGETLTRTGAQAMGWICQVPPVLPPIDDPEAAQQGGDSRPPDRTPLERAVALFDTAGKLAHEEKTKEAQAALTDAVRLYDELIRSNPEQNGPLLAPAVLQALARMGVDFSVPEVDLRQWLAQPDSTPFPAIAQALLQPGWRLKDPVHLDVVSANYEKTPEVTSPRHATDVREDLLKAAIVQASNGRHNTQVQEFGKLLRP